MHLHSGVDEMSYVLEGNITVQHIWNVSIAGLLNCYQILYVYDKE
jgi:hypothetical protein